MSAERVPVDDPGALRRILANAEALLLDFDGPVCSVFAGFPAHLVAHQLRGVLADGGHDQLPAVIEKADDPFDVLRYAAKLGHDEARYVEAAMRAHEVEAVATATPTPGAHELIREWRAIDRKLAIVSNNSAAAVEAYLHRHELTKYIQFVSARTHFDPRLLKPNPHLVDLASSRLSVVPEKCTLIGDAPTDIQAAHASRTSAIGFANKPGKDLLLSEELPLAIVSDMTLFTAAIQAL